MQKEAVLIALIRIKIKEILETVTKVNSPKVYEIIQTESGYKMLEEMIINKVCLSNITPSACIPHIEREM